MGGIVLSRLSSWYDCTDLQSFTPKPTALGWLLLHEGYRAWDPISCAARGVCLRTPPTYPQAPFCWCYDIRRGKQHATQASSCGFCHDVNPLMDGGSVLIDRGVYMRVFAVLGGSLWIDRTRWISMIVLSMLHSSLKLGHGYIPPRQVETNHWWKIKSNLCSVSEWISAISVPKQEVD